ncbi:MAG: sigma factor, partial [Gimesia sp.]|nr:sigma factor [Gimesia sp.]
MDQSDNTEQFVQQLTENQNRLYGYVYSLLGDHSRAEDVLQETNLVLWRKIG